MPTLLAIDDDPLILKCFQHVFSEASFELVTARSAREGLTAFLRQPPAVVILDLKLPDMSGMDAFRRLHELDPKVPVILITGFGTAETVIQAMQMGAYEYMTKPLDPDQLSALVARAFEVSRLMQLPAALPEGEPRQDISTDVLLGRCSAMADVCKSIGRVAPQDVTVLILGESGTGKELVARAIYQYGGRASGRFLALNCAAIPETLLESELFGHEKGAFTGADRKRIGKFEQCNGGTLFLDEIGDMSPVTQSKLLRLLQEQRFERVGGTETIKTDVRLIAATNRDLTQMMLTGAFRSDLYFRLNTFTIKLPPLRERKDDIPLLAEHFLHRFSRAFHKEMRQISSESMALLRSYPWPGNVRELQSALKQAILQATGPVLVPQFLPAQLRTQHRSVPTPQPSTPLDSDNLADFIQQRLKANSTNLYAEFHALTERQLLSEVLIHAFGNQTRAARILGITRPTLRAKLASLGISASRQVPTHHDPGSNAHQQQK